ncbi:MAG TPA: YceI family protein [Bacteroidota bacterium]|nr:YceI family protein [Bacteroidota bacterium]
MIKHALIFLSIFCLTAAHSQAQSFELNKNESTVTYTLTHLLHVVDATSKDVAYHIDGNAAAKKINGVTAQVDVTTFDSGNSNRDSHAMEVVDAITYPYTTFSSTSVTQLGDSLHITGKLTFHGITGDITMLGKAIWTEHRLEVQGNFVLSLTAYKVERPSLLMVPVNDDLHFALKAVFNIK